MKKVFVFIICLSFQHTTFTGCHCQLEPEPYAYSVTIDLLDRNTGRSLIALRDSNYYADSIILESSNPVHSYRMAVNRSDTLLRSEYVFPGISNIDTLYFRYRTTKIDTFMVFFHGEKVRKCGERFSVIKIDKAILNRAVACEPCNNFWDPIRIRK